MKQVLSFIAVVLVFAAYIPYYRDLIKGKIRPHIISWFLWTLIPVITVALQFLGGAGSAVWIMAVVAVLGVGVIILSLKNGKRDITKVDILVAVMALVSLGFWLVADQPVTAVILLSVADTCAFLPTIRKSWGDPHSETLALWIINVVRFGVGLLALENYTILSTLPFAEAMIMTASVAAILLYHRARIPKPEPS